MREATRSGVIDLILHAVAFAFQYHGFGVVEEAIEYSGSDSGVVVEDFRPVFEDAIGGEENGAAFIAVADDLEQEVGAGFVERQIAELIDQEQIGLEVFVHFELEPSGGVGGGQGVDDIDGGGEQHAMAFHASRMT